MKGFIARVRGEKGVALATHLVEVEKEAEGRVAFHFKRIIANTREDTTSPIPQMEPASFAQQLRSMHRAYAVTCVPEEQYQDFIEMMLKETYDTHASLEIEEIEE